MIEPTSRFWQLFLELFESLPRQGPGNRACTERALGLCNGLPPFPKVADLGCGVGGQTLHLAAMTRGTIVAVDLHEPSISSLRETVSSLGLSDRIFPMVADMADTGLLPGSFDLVWSEGALYSIGMERALSVSGNFSARGDSLPSQTPCGSGMILRQRGRRASPSITRPWEGRMTFWRCWNKPGSPRQAILPCRTKPGGWTSTLPWKNVSPRCGNNTKPTKKPSLSLTGWLWNLKCAASTLSISPTSFSRPGGGTDEADCGGRKVDPARISFSASGLFLRKKDDAPGSGFF